ncbi:MAG: OmpH family outer membrane protein [Bacteroidetes bacterium]|nr:OmpH family outer membrane protein [Bacteroidota bacterium]
MSEENNIVETTEQTPEKPNFQPAGISKNEAETCKHSRCGMYINIILAIAVIVLYILFFTSKNKKEVSQPVSIKTALTIAYVDSDSLWENYEYVKDTKKELKDLELRLTNDYKAKTMAFQSEYENYLKTGASLTKTEQIKKEEALKEKQNSILALKESFGSQLMEEKEKKNIQLQDSIFAYVKRFNQGPKYSFILEKSRSSSLLFANDSLDITKTIIKGLNEAYTKSRNK